MWKQAILGIICAAALLLPTATLSQQAYDYRLIDYPGTSGFTQVFGISEQGKVVGTGGGQYPFVYSVREGTITDVANVAGYISTGLIGISRSGHLVGSVVDIDAWRGWVRTPQGIDIVFTHPDATTTTQARGVNSSGLVSGFRDTEYGGAAGFIYDSRTGDFANIVPSLATLAHGMNSRGDVAGSAIFDASNDPCPGLPGDPNGFKWYGWLRKANGSVSYFVVNDGFTLARDINDMGQVVGIVIVDNGPVIKGFVTTLGSSACQAVTVAAEDMLEFPGSVPATLPGGISNSGAVVGQFEDDQGRLYGFIASPR